jgi:hypothetical protein
LACKAEEERREGAREKEVRVLLPLPFLLLYYCYYVITTHNEGAKVVPSAHNGAAVAETRWRGLQESVAADTARIEGLRRPVSLTPTAVLVGAWVQTHSVTKQ